MSNSGSFGIIKNNSQSLILPKILTNTLDQLHDPYVIKDLDSRYIYANRAVAKLAGVRSPENMLCKQDGEIQSRLTQNSSIVDEWQNQDRLVAQNEKVITTLEIHLQTVQYPYIVRKLPFYNENDQCVGIVMYSRSIENFNLNKYIKINAPVPYCLINPMNFLANQSASLSF